MQSPSWRSAQQKVLLFNFGGPENATQVNPFLKKLFEDPFIIRTRMPEALRRFLAKRIADKRTEKATAEYESIGYSPINRYTNAQAQHLENLLRKSHPNTTVQVVNRYTQPFASEVVKNLDPENERLFMISLYPHICHSTTVSSYRDFDLALRERFGSHHVTTSRVFSWWHNPKYLAYSSEQVFRSLTNIARQSDEPVTVLFSAHGIPDRYHLRGDPYVHEIYAHFSEIQRRCHEHFAQMGKDSGKLNWQLAFQSRVGPVEWVRPYTDESIGRLGKNGGHLLVVPVSFVSDHIETLYEMDQTYKELALRSGFKSYQRVIPANDDPALAECLADILANHGF